MNSVYLLVDALITNFIGLDVMFVNRVTAFRLVNVALLSGMIIVNPLISKNNSDKTCVIGWAKSVWLCRLRVGCVVFPRSHCGLSTRSTRDLFVAQVRINNNITLAPVSAFFVANRFSV